MAVSTMVGAAKNGMRFRILVFVEAQEINLRGNLQILIRDGDCIFLREFFHFTKNFLVLLTLYVFFEIFLPQAPVIFSIY